MGSKSTLQSFSDWGQPRPLFKYDVANITILNSITCRPLFILELAPDQQ